ncbi:MAG: hypothetical protein ACF8TS_03305 [Maioricimonas sp. JB049]
MLEAGVMQDLRRTLRLRSNFDRNLKNATWPVKSPPRSAGGGYDDRDGAATATIFRLSVFRRKCVIGVADRQRARRD